MRFPAVLLLLPAACRAPVEPRGDRIVARGAPCDAAVVARFEAPAIDPGAPFASAPILATPCLSAHAVSAVAPIPPHHHARHEETVYVVSGRARMQIGEAWHELGPGSLVHVPIGVVHAVEPLAPCSVLSIFAPPFDGRDRVFAD